MKVLILLALFCTAYSHAQERNINDILKYTLSYRGITERDITIPIDFFSQAEKSPTNDAKLLLPLVRDMMIIPMSSNQWLDSISSKSNTNRSGLVRLMFDLLSYKKLDFEDISIEYGHKDLEAVSIFIKENISQDKSRMNKALTKISDEDKNFLSKHLLSILDEGDDDYPNVSDILVYNQRRDSSLDRSKRVMDILTKMYGPDEELNSPGSLRNFSLSNLHFALTIEELITQHVKNEPLDNKNTNYVQGGFYYYSNENGIRIAIGGPGKNTYTGKFDFIIDLGGDDIYNVDHPPLTKGELSMGGFSCIIDLAGNDYYTTSSDFALAGGLFSSSFIFDKSGDDYYESKGSGNLGAAIGGLGLLYDEKGNDTYKGLSFSIGAGCFGVGLLVDREGNDFYIANSYSQGFGMTQGVGAIVDNKGNDSYLIDSRSLDIGRYNDHYVSMCQGYGLGLRPFYAGGIGLIIEGEGNDIYNTDIFGQGGAYWYSLGAIVDKGGHDKYNGYQYSQGAGIHLAVGLIKDYDGWDFYQSNGVSQGCGHDFGFGMLWDVKGNDNYSAYSLSQGAGNADGIGILIDESGTDGYLNKYPSNTNGYGNARREYGSIGIFLDASGTDYYSKPGFDSTLTNSSTWGTANDFWLGDLPEQVSGDNYKVPVDSASNSNPSNNSIPNTNPGNYSTADYFAMAKTIEPRFSLWQEYGFRKLIEDSTNTAKYITTKFNTTDHRDVQVFRVLAIKIQWSIAHELIEKLRLYTLGQAVYTQSEISMICYVFGETRDPSAKEYLLKLTGDSNYKIRSSAINALGKIKYDQGDAAFLSKAAERLRTLAMEDSDKKLYRKDITFALNNFRTPENIPVLMHLLKDDFYGPRFVASDNLRAFGDSYFAYINESAIYSISDSHTWLNPFLYSLLSLNEGNFRSVIELLLEKFPNSDGLMYENIVDVLKQRKQSSTDAGFNSWCEELITAFQSRLNSRIMLK